MVLNSWCCAHHKSPSLARLGSTVACTAPGWPCLPAHGQHNNSPCHLIREGPHSANTSSSAPSCVLAHTLSQSTGDRGRFQCSDWPALNKVAWFNWKVPISLVLAIWLENKTTVLKNKANENAVHIEYDLTGHLLLSVTTIMMIVKWFYVPVKFLKEHVNRLVSRLLKSVKTKF